MSKTGVYVCFFKINAGSLESPFNNQTLQCLVAFAKQPTQIPCILELMNFAFDPSHLTLTSEERTFYGRCFVCVKLCADFIKGINQILCIKTCIELNHFQCKKI